MNDEHDPFEAELHNLRPREISQDLQRRIALDLAADRTASSTQKWRGRLALAGGLVAASLLAAVLWPRGHEEPIPKVRITSPISPQPLEVPEPMPTFRAYQIALRQSPEAVEALADRYAALSLATNQSSKWARAFPLANADLP